MADLADGAAGFTTDGAELDTGGQRAVRTATGDAACNVDWNGIGSSDDSTLATLRLLHSARQSVDTSRWWTLRWPNNAISLLGTACGLNTEGTYKLFREMRKVMLQHVRELWAVVMDRRHATGNEAKRAALKGEWLKLSRILTNMRSRRGKLMPGWATVRLKIEADLNHQVSARAMAKAAAATGSDGWPARC